MLVHPAVQCHSGRGTRPLYKGEVFDQHQFFGCNIATISRQHVIMVMDGRLLSSTGILDSG